MKIRFLSSLLISSILLSIPDIQANAADVFKKAGKAIKKTAEKVGKEIKEIGEDILEQLGNVPIGANSGLAIFSKYPIKRTMLKDYTCFVGEGAFARKGLLGAQLEINGQTVYIFTTHLQAGIGDERFESLEKKGFLAHKSNACVIDGKSINPKKLSDDTSSVRYAELQQAKRWIEEFAHDKSAPILFAGDFNIKSTESIVQEVFPEATILYDSVKSRPHTGSIWNIDDRTVVETDRIDWMIIVRNPNDLMRGNAWIVDWFTPDHTDHLGYFGEFEFDTLLMITLKKPTITSVLEKLAISLVNNKPEQISIVDITGKTPLIQAALRGKTRVVKAILNKVDRPIIALAGKDNQGNTALHYAAMNGHKDTIAELLKRGASYLTKNNEGKTPIDVASSAEIKEDIKGAGAVLLVESYLKVDKTVGRDNFPALLRQINQGKINVKDLPEEIKKKLYDRYMQYVEEAAQGIPTVCTYGACSAYIKKQKEAREVCLFAHTNLSESPMNRQQAVNQCIEKLNDIRRKLIAPQFTSIDEQMKQYANDPSSLASLKKQRKTLNDLLLTLSKQETPLWNKLRK